MFSDASGAPSVAVADPSGTAADAAPAPSAPVADRPGTAIAAPPTVAPGGGAAVVRAGFIPLVDCAPLAVAARLGFAEAEGLTIDLGRQTSWASLRDRLAVGRIDVAHMLAPIPIAASLGLAGLTMPMIAPLALGRGGNAITLSAPLWRTLAAGGVDPGDGPAAVGAALAAAVAGRSAPLTFAMVHPFSAHNYLLRYFLAAAGVDPDRDVRLVVVPPPYVVEALKSGQIDGFCVGEPWNSLAVESGAGVLAATAAEIWRESPCKVLGVTEGYAAAEPARLAALVRALRRAAAWCDDPANHGDLAALLAAPDLVGVSARVIGRALAGRLVAVPGAAPRSLPGFLAFAAEAPQPAHAAWFHRQMVRWGQAPASAGDAARAAAVFRPDLFTAATGLAATPQPTQHFFDRDEATGTAD